MVEKLNEMKIRFLFFVLITSFICGCSNTQSKSNWDELCAKFQSGFEELNLAPLQMGYVQNLELIKNQDSISMQKEFFLSMNEELRKIDPENIPKDQRLDYDIMLYETALNLERIGLEEKWKSLKVDSISNCGLQKVPNGKAWYAYYLKKWVDIESNPESMFHFGLSEIERVKSKMKDLQQQSGLDSSSFQNHINRDSFYFHNVEDIQISFQSTKDRISKRVGSFFPFVDKVKDVNIALGTNKAMAKAPGYYREGTFYYNYTDSSFNKRDINWLYLHEATPGHHYQMTLEESLARSAIQDMFEYYGFLEGYAAYVEELGYELGAYQNIYDELGKWEWDIIRSVRVAMDVGLNYYNWSEEEALEFWQQHIKGEDKIAKREIARMKRWPAQVITYKYGANKILNWKEQLKSEKDFDEKKFHGSILSHGSLPFSILEKLVILKD